MKVAFRTDASQQIGTGHVMRCLALADTLRARATDCSFICRELPGHCCDRVEAAGYRVHRLPAPSRGWDAGNGLAHSHWLEQDWRMDAEETRNAIGSSGVDWLVVDHYALDVAWERQIRATARRILAIDDLADRVHDCDLLLDQNLQQGGRYADRVPPDCRQLIGPRYALLRQEFAEVRAKIGPRDGKVRRLFVFLGGVDSGNFTGLVLQSLVRLGRDAPAADIVIGAANPHRLQLREECARLSRVELHEDIANMATLMARADLAVGAGGVTAWERACLGLPSLILAVAPNQSVVANGLADAGAALTITCQYDNGAVLAQNLLSLFSQPERLRAMAQRNLDLVDGRGARRVAGVMIGATIHLRQAIEEDCGNIFIWRNTETVRRYFHDPAPISWDTHQDWFRTTLQCRDRILLIAELAGEPVGVLRFDLNGDLARVSIYMVPTHGGQSLGSELLRHGEQWLMQRAPLIRRLCAEVKHENRASRQIFNDAEYKLTQDVFYKEIRPT